MDELLQWIIQHISNTLGVVIGRESVKVEVTENKLHKTFSVNNHVYIVTCLEYKYHILADRWYIPDRTYYAYKVTSRRGNNIVQGWYPLTVPTWMRIGDFALMLAVRLHFATARGTD